MKKESAWVELARQYTCVNADYMKLTLKQIRSLPETTNCPVEELI